MLKRRLQGFSLIELMVTVAIASVLLAVAAPSFSIWLQNTRIRNTAQDIFAGVERAKAEAVKRNTQVRFQLTNNLSATCALSTTGTAWAINQVANGSPSQDASGACNVAIDSAATTPRLLATRPPEAANSKVQVLASASSVVFTSLGKLPSPVPAADMTIDVTATSGTCLAQNGTLTCLRIVVSPAGQARMCNPKFAAPDPQAC
jgi:type IV fimbrial biogenesis protein FimT